MQWAGRCAGREAFAAVNGHGYRKGSVDGHHVAAHIVVWALVHGEWPEGQVDHEDTDRSSNRPGNPAFPRPKLSEIEAWEASRRVYR